MTEQEQIVARMGSTLRSIHVDKHNPDKDDCYWEEFAVACERERASRLGMQKEFDEAVAAGRIKDISHRISIAMLLNDGKRDRRTSFWSGLFVGCLITLLFLSLRH